MGWSPTTGRLLKAAAAALLAAAVEVQAAGSPDGDVASWLREHGHVLQKVKKHSVDDLRFLAPLLEGSRLVLLGESVQGTREESLAKLRLVRYLHGELGYDVLAFESPLYQCDRADIMVASGDPALAMTACVQETWQTREVLQLFKHIQQTRATDHPLRLAGFDIQPGGWSTRGRPALLREIVLQVDPEYATAVMALDAELLRELGKGDDAGRDYLRRERSRLVSAYGKLAGFLELHAGALAKAFEGTGREKEPEVARQTALSIVRYVEQQAAGSAREALGIRSRAMADNLEYILEKRFPGRKVMVWGHNLQLRNDNAAVEPEEGAGPGAGVPTLGGLIAGLRGGEMYTIGVCPGSGRAAGPGGSIQEIPPPLPGTLEGLLAGAGEEVLFVDFSRAQRSAATEWIFTGIPVRDDGPGAVRMIPRNQYDAMLFIAEVSPHEEFR